MRHKVTLNHLIIVYTDMFDHMDGSFRAFAKNNIRWTEDLVSAMKFGWQKRLKNYASVTPMTGMRLI